jgi:hypothetical protein
MHCGPHPGYPERGVLLLLQMEREWKSNDNKESYPAGSLTSLDAICVVRDAESHIVLYHPRMPEYEPHLTWQQKRWLKEHPNFPW